MSTGFAFVPRKVALRRNGAKVTHLPQPPETTHSSPQPTPASSKGKEKAADIESRSQETQQPNTKPLADEDDAILVWLALSDYALWADGDLRRKLEVHEAGGGGGYISLNYLLSHTLSLWPLKRFVGASQTPLVKAIRQYAPGLFDLQLTVSTPQPWFNKSGAAVAPSSASSGPGGYEIRRRDWLPSGLSKKDWDERIVYVEHVPPEYKTISALVRFLSALLPTSEHWHPRRRIQCVTLPPHRQDAEGSKPSFKGFAFITFYLTEDVNYVLASHPWNPSEASLTPRGNTPADRAAKVGFRTLRKAEWETLRTEYLAYRQSLVTAINDFQDSREQPMDGTPLPQRIQKAAPIEQSQLDVLSPVDGASSNITLQSPYPYGCLIFVKNIHIETNKTTLKALFGRILDPFNPTGSDIGLDYVDFTKGMDTCYLRLSTPAHADRLTSHFHSATTIQRNGLDDQGAGPRDIENIPSKPIFMEVVTGTREEVYWQKVPHKIRKSAVEKAVRLSGESHQGGRDDGPDIRPQKRRRKR